MSITVSCNNGVFYDLKTGTLMTMLVKLNFPFFTLSYLSYKSAARLKTNGRVDKWVKRA